MKRILLFCLITRILTAADPAAALLAPFTGKNITNREMLAALRPDIERAVESFSRMDINALKTNRSYVSIGTVYTYHAMLLPESDVDGRIRSYERALMLRKDPDSIYNLATCYKSKYNDAVERGDTSNEVAYGKKIYHELDLYIKISPVSGKKTAERRDYFRMYLDQ